MNDSEPMAYVGHCPTCDALCAAAVDKPEYARDNAKFVAQMIRDGLRLERMSCAAVRAGEWCKCPRPKKKRRARSDQQSLPLSGHNAANGGVAVAASIEVPNPTMETVQ